MDRSAEEVLFCIILRHARAKGQRVTVTYYTGHGRKVTHAKGLVAEVASSGAFVRFESGLHVPLDVVANVERHKTKPRATEPTTAPDGA